MRNRSTFNDFGVNPNPNVDFKASSGVIVLKVFTCFYNGAWYAGYQLSIYSKCKSATSQLVFPSLKNESFRKHDLALKAGVGLLNHALWTAIVKDNHIAFFYETKKFLQFKKSLSL